MPTSSPILSIKTIENIINQYDQDTKKLNISSLTSMNVYSHNDTSPYLNKFKLNSIYNDLLKLKYLLNKFKNNKNFIKLSNNLNDLINLIDEKSYINDNMIKRFDDGMNISVDQTDEQLKEELEMVPKIPQLSIQNENDLNSLRQRLLSNAKGSNLLENSTTNSNNYHDSFQNDILNDLNDLSQVLKDSAIKFSNKLFGDSKVLDDTERNLVKNANVVTLVSGNLNNYLMNKSGNKISLFWLIKVFLMVFIVFIFIIILTKILPHM